VRNKITKITVQFRQTFCESLRPTKPKTARRWDECVENGLAFIHAYIEYTTVKLSMNCQKKKQPFDRPKRSGINIQFEPVELILDHAYSRTSRERLYLCNGKINDTLRIKHLVTVLTTDGSHEIAHEYESFYE